MKKTIILLFTFCLTAVLGLNAQTWNSDNNNVLNTGKAGAVEWDKTMHDFGKLRHGKPTFTVFKMTNIGGQPVFIAKAEGSCGCTEIEYPKRPVRPGETVDIIVNYDADDYGVFNKTVTLTLNIEDSSQVLHIKGVVK